MVPPVRAWQLCSTNQWIAIHTVPTGRIGLLCPIRRKLNQLLILNVLERTADQTVFLLQLHEHPLKNTIPEDPFL